MLLIGFTFLTEIEVFTGRALIADASQRAHPTTVAGSSIVNCGTRFFRLALWFLRSPFLACFRRKGCCLEDGRNELGKLAGDVLDQAGQRIIILALRGLWNIFLLTICRQFILLCAVTEFWEVSYLGLGIRGRLLLCNHFRYAGVLPRGVSWISYYLNFFILL